MGLADQTPGSSGTHNPAFSVQQSVCDEDIPIGSERLGRVPKAVIFQQPSELTEWAKDGWKSQLNQQVRSRVSRTVLRYFAIAFAALFFVVPAFCQDSQECLGSDFDSYPQQDKLADQAAAQTKPPDQSNPAPKPEDPTNSGRMFFVMPNFLTVENEASVPPISWKEKFVITSKGAFDPYEFFIVGVLSGIRQADNAYPAFGQGMAGYGKRYGTAFADQVDGNIMVGAVFPTILKTDPRYFQLGKGSFAKRFGYAISRIFVARKDSGGSTFNFSEFVGNGTAIGISNVYYPAADRSFSSSLSDWGTQMALDALGNELKEFWPDLHRKYSHWKQNRSAPASQ
jgi:hypothetical protein